jgi:hypothetical protein
MRVGIIGIIGEGFHIQHKRVGQNPQQNANIQHRAAAEHTQGQVS